MAGKRHRGQRPEAGASCRGARQDAYSGQEAHYQPRKDQGSARRYHRGGRETGQRLTE